MDLSLRPMDEEVIKEIYQIIPVTFCTLTLQNDSSFVKQPIGTIKNTEKHEYKIL